MIAKHLVKILSVISVASTLAALAATHAYLGARDAVIKERSICNEAVLESALAKEKIEHAQFVKYHNQVVADLVSIAHREALAREVLEQERDRALADRDDREQTIIDLMLEASTNELPDSFACLNAFAPADAVDWLRVQATDCGVASRGKDIRKESICASTPVFDAPDTARGPFSDYTYGELIIVHGRDRETIRILNGQLKAIESLQGSEGN